MAMDGGWEELGQLFGWTNDHPKGVHTGKPPPSRMSSPHKKGVSKAELVQYVPSCGGEDIVNTHYNNV